MASPVRSSGQLPPRSLRFGKEASTAKGSTSRLTPVQLAKVAREECEKLMGSVSSVYSPAELERAKQMKAREYEARPDQLPPDDPQRPPLPANNAPLEDFHRLRLLDGLEGVLNKDRGKIDAWLNRLQTKERQEQLSDLDEWFENFREREPELAKFLRDCESEVEQGRILCQRSENLVNKLSEDAVHTRHEVEAFVGRKLKPMAGAGEGGMVHAVERKRRLAQIHHDEAHLAKRVLDEMMQEREEALVQAKKDFYDQRLSRMRMQQAEQDEIQQLQSNIDERWGFAGRKSADAALHEKAGPELLAECRAQASSLKFGEVVVTKAPNLKARYVLHTVVPGHPSSKDPRPMPVDRAADYASDVAEAQQLLRQSFRGLVAKAVELNAKSFCCPAIGSGIRGFPASFVAKEGLHLLVPQAEGSIAQEVPYVEVRFWDHHVLNAWTLEACQRKLEECEDHATV
ncbi:unnamed protein product [Durusdinium trenchii]|uniref:Macro domain-containing protein n=1 Tax=Durusdinium trenchii TaxID=1381693 RepID=A0ABP0H6R0_9DINO